MDWEITRHCKLLEQLIAMHTGQPLEKVSKDTDRDSILTAEEAMEYGVVDDVITSRKVPSVLAAVGAEDPWTGPPRQGRRRGDGVPHCRGNLDVTERASAG